MTYDDMTTTTIMMITDCEIHEVYLLLLQQLMGFDRSMALYLIDMFDTNHDGHLDKTEFIQMWSSMFGR